MQDYHEQDQSNSENPHLAGKRETGSFSAESGHACRTRSFSSFRPVRFFSNHIERQRIPAGIQALGCKSESPVISQTDLFYAQDNRGIFDGWCDGALDGEFALVHGQLRLARLERRLLELSVGATQRRIDDEKSSRRAPDLILFLLDYRCTLQNLEEDNGCCQAASEKNGNNGKVGQTYLP
ncbi:MAG TPA: hypothetical protein VMG35_01435 [Bryobacteraceae bacterium]|nr:hypothetical protein [Bryobacteraceae bacterium]